MNDAELIDAVLVHEGSEYTNVPGDHGGPTKFGVTLATLSAWRHQDCTPFDVEHLSLTEARVILQDLYIKQPGFERIASDVLRGALVDFGVNSGPAQAIKALQKVLGVTVDGVLGPETEKAANLKTGPFLALKVNAGRVRLYGRIITNDPTQAKFASGWANRIADQIEAAIP